MEEIKNKVQESGLIQLDLADFKPKVEILEVDIAPQLWEGLILKEKDFRQWIKEHNWSRYEKKAVFVHCSADAIVPTWAFMLVASKLVQNAQSFCIGSKLDLEKQLIKNAIESLDISAYQDGKIIIKGCSDINCPEYAMSELLARLQPHVKSIMYGEPCSTVPVFKRKD